MPKIVSLLLLSFLISCSGKTDHKAEAGKLVTRWCELTEKVHHSQGDERERATRELKKFEQEMDRKYHRTDAVSREAQDLLDKGCEELLKEK